MILQDRIVTRAIAESAAGLAEDLLDCCQRLVRIPSLPGEEAAVQDEVAGEFERLGLEVERVETRYDHLRDHPAFSDDGLPPAGRHNMVGRWRGADPHAPGHSLILNGHVDVVSPGDENQWTESPWSGTIRDGRLYGRGACDMKSGLAAGIHALAALKAAGLRPRHDVLIESVIGEESGGVGTLTTIARGITADAALILEPTSLAICPVQSGALTFRISIPGRSAHGAMRQLGVSAIEKLGIIHSELLQLEEVRHATFSHPLYQDPRWAAPISVGTVRGGSWPSSVPDEVVIEGRMGVFPGEGPASAREAFETAITLAAKGDGFLASHPPTIEWVEGQFESGETPSDHDFVRTVAGAHARVFGGPPAMAGVPYGSDLRLFTNHARIPAVLYGPGDVRLAHAANESIAVEEIVGAARSIAVAVALWCGVERAA